MTYLFVDTNVLLHYRRLEEIDWLSLSESDAVTIVLCPAIIRELDRHKVSHPQGKFRKRAQEVIASLHSWLSRVDSDVIRDGVRLEFVSEDPSLDFGAHRLRLELDDDWLIASVIDWKQKHPTDETSIVSADLGIAIKAKPQRIRVIAPSYADKLADEMDADERRLMQLQKELAEMKSLSPSLSLCFRGEAEGQNFLQFRIQPPIAYDPDKITKEMNQIRLKQLLDLPPDKPGTMRLSRVESILQQYSGRISLPITKEHVAVHQASLETYYQNYEAYLRNLHNHRNTELRRIEFEIGLKNGGSAPAQDVDIHLHFPDGFQLLNGDDPLPGEPKPPRPPGPPGTIDFASIGLDGLRNIAVQRPVVQSIGSPPNVSSPFIRRSNSYEVRSHVQKAKHCYILRVAKFYVIFDSYDSAGSFKIEYSISAANLPKAASGILSVVVEKD